jgi:hypothetical protein
MNPTRDEQYNFRIAQQIEHLEKLIDERDRRYEERFKSAESLRHAEIAAIRQSSEFLVSTFKEAMQKSEQAQGAYNISHNDLIRKMENQYQHMMPREEAISKFDDLKESITNLQQSRSASAGKSEGLHAGWAYLMGGIILVATLVHLFISLLVTK